MPAYCIGVDVGGTFTDVVLSDGTRVWRAKSPSSTTALGEGVIAGCRLVAQRAGMTLERLLPQVARFGLGSTAVTNVIAARTGRRVGLITTHGFEDLVPIARVRREPREGWLVPPDGLIERDWILGVAERVDRDGKILQALDSDEVVRAAQTLLEKHQVEAIAVSFLWSCANPVHEQQALQAIRSANPGVTLVSGAALHPVVREYERTTFALLNAYTSGALSGIDELVDELQHLGLSRPPLLIHSGGGSISVAEGRRAPAVLAESGPAAGVVGALAVCRAEKIADAVACDMGGTSFDMSIIRQSEPLRRTRGNLMGVWTALAMVDIESVTAGGGSIGWADSMGFLRVGPRSAGARPGPACYGRGGINPTVTDALVVLGYIDPQHFLGGEMRLDCEAARNACARLGTQMGTDAIKAAWGIWEIAKVEMIRALRAQFAQRGLDPREFAIISMGGCGGLFNPLIAQELGVRRVLIPELTSVLSAFGAANADIRRERTRSIGMLLPAAGESLAVIATELTQTVSEDLAADGIAAADRTVTFEADLRFMRQQFELTIPCDPGFSAQAQDNLIMSFTSEYQRRYGQGALVSGAPVELVSLRAVGRGRTVRAELVHSSPNPAAKTQQKHQRQIWVGDGSQVQPMNVDVLSSVDLRPGEVIQGPALLDGADTTIWIPPRVAARLSEHRTIDMEVMA
ncbi:MAG TPA: hydantoinase/oxoprolinase family protein [Steroidobacteraceae bacterium]|nr:hydantoinase/oxoprolinase family protein [Steroidobacteraceae bacterium]